MQPMQHIHDLLVLLVPTISAIGLFALLTVASWAKARQRERESFQRAELLRKLAESSGEANAQVLQLLREDDETRIRRRREGLILAGMIWLVLGAGFIAVGHLIPHLENSGTWALGILPMFAGAAILVHAIFFAARPGRRG